MNIHSCLPKYFDSNFVSLNIQIQSCLPTHLTANILLDTLTYVFQKIIICI